jgi:hypothetical protein
MYTYEMLLGKRINHSVRIQTSALERREHRGRCRQQEVRRCCSSVRTESTVEDFSIAERPAANTISIGLARVGEAKEIARICTQARLSEPL